MVFLFRVLIIFYFGIANSETLQAQEEVKETDIASSHPGDHKVRVFYRERWENAFDVRYISIAKKEHYLIGAQWNRKFSWGSMIGMGALGTPTNATIRKNGVKDSYSFYGLGGFIGHQVFDYRPFRLILFVNGGKGILYHRNEISGSPPTFGGAQFTYLDPGAYVTFYTWRSIDIGLSFSAFAVKFEKNNHIKDEDLTGASAGLTFRTLFH